MATRKNLDDRNYFLREDNTNNPYLNIHDLDDVVGSGFHSFYIVGSRYLLRGSEIEFEIVDSAGNAVQIAGVRSIRKGNARIISFSITDEVANGGATLYVSAILNQYLDENNFPLSIPSEWNNKPNLLFSYNFTIDKDRVNSDDIIFRKKPKISITPKVEEVKKINKNSITVATGSGGSALTGSVIRSRKISESEYVVEFETDQNIFKGEMKGGNIRFISRKYTDSGGNERTFSYKTYREYPTDDGYEGDIGFVRSSNIAELILENPDLSTFGPGGNISYENTFIPKDQDIIFEIDYVTIPFNEETLIQQKTYADIQLRDLHTVSGDVELIKIYTKSDSAGTNYSLAFEGNVDEQDSLLEIIDNFDIGTFNSSSKLLEWTASDATNPNNTPTDTTPELVLSDEKLLNGVIISGSNEVFTKTVEGNELQAPLYSMESNTSFTIFRDVEYRILLNAAVENVLEDDTRLDIYLSGSGLPADQCNRFGDLVHSFRTNADNKWLGDEYEIVYNGDYTLTDARIIFVVTSAKWHLSDIEILPQLLQGFTPGEYRTQIPLEILRPNQDIDFKFEFFDSTGAKSSTVLFENNITFERPNLVIEGQHNVLTGSLFVGQTSGSGVQFGSSGDGGNFASVGYEGFTSASLNLAPAGFLIWSGSVLPNSGDNYQGVGLELVIDSGSYFRYRTNPEQLTVITDNFFFGDPNSQFISGSNGNIEISSSLFHLDPTNNILIVSGTIKASAGKIGGFEITPHALTGSGFFLSGSATGNDFFISSSNFNVKASGDITGSSVLFDGGKIAGWRIAQNFISASNLIIDSAGKLSTADFASGVRGWKITSTGNGSAEFENVKIRGTLQTVVFEKETVNAVGGQLWVANSSAITQSFVSASDTTMSVANVTGFKVNEVLLAKKVTDSGINSEYILIESTSRFNPGSNTDLRGDIYVQRAIGAGQNTGSDVTWVSELAESSASYTQGQVLVSTGRTGSGWILLNAAPESPPFTPFIDIVERTGSGVYDYNLEVRLGDLSGLTRTQLLGRDPATAGHGLFTENAFLQGGIIANFGEIGGFAITEDVIKSSGSDNFFLSGSATGNEYFISSSKFNVKANGDVTGSSVLFDGGTIGGFNITSNRLFHQEGAGYIEMRHGSGFQRFLVTPDGDLSGGSGNFVQLFWNSGSNSWGIQGKDAGNDVFELGSTNRIAGWSFDNNEFQSSNRSGGSDGNFTNAGIVLNSAGWISAPSFSLASDGDARFAGTVTASNLRIDNNFSLGVSMSVDAGGRIEWGGAIGGGGGVITDGGITLDYVTEGSETVVPPTASTIVWGDGTNNKFQLESHHVDTGASSTGGTKYDQTSFRYLINDSTIFLRYRKNYYVNGDTSATGSFLRLAGKNQIELAVNGNDILLLEDQRASFEYPVHVDGTNSRLVIPVGTDKFAT